jgi:hypothetical protein
MHRCAQCGFELNADLALCPHHHMRDDRWAEWNRVMCDLLHRGRVPARLSAIEREEPVLTVGG